MAKNDNYAFKNQQLSLFDEFFENMKDFGRTLSVDELDVAIESLSNAINTAKYQRRELRRREALAKKHKEEKRKKEAEAEHIQKVTSMDLPLDWNNIFNTDKRTEGVHTDSISDALIMSLNTLGCVDIEYISSIIL